MILGLLVVSLSVAIFDKKKSQNLTFRKPQLETSMLDGLLN